VMVFGEGARIPNCGRGGGCASTESRTAVAQSGGTAPSGAPRPDDQFRSTRPTHTLALVRALGKRCASTRFEERNSIESITRRRVSRRNHTAGRYGFGAEPRCIDGAAEAPDLDGMRLEGHQNGLAL